jgi:hypothetical protein
MYAEHMHLGASEPAMVVSRVPLIVAAHAGDLDAAVLLRFPASFVPRYGLGVGTRLLVVNTYQEVRGTQNADPWYAVDLIPGPDRHQWQNAFPLVAEFLSDDAERIERRKREIPEEEWRRLDENARRRIQRWGIETARDARPTLAKTPHRLGGDEYFQPIEAFERGPVRRPRALARALEVVVTLVIAAIALALLHWAWTVQGGL